jgi:hypothetical protein
LTQHPIHFLDTLTSERMSSHWLRRNETIIGKREREWLFDGQSDRQMQSNKWRTERKKLARRKNNSFKYLKRFRKYKKIDSQKLELAWDR